MNTLTKVIVPSAASDIDRIFELYDAAIAYQKTVFNKNWQGFKRSLVESELAEQRQWKILIDGQIASIFAIAFNDPMIWKEKDNDPSIYIHRIVTNPAFRGQNFVTDIISWAREFGLANDKEFIRLDTWGDNPRLIAYYQKCGFNYLGNVVPEPSETLPKHYEDIELALFELPVKA